MTAILYEVSIIVERAIRADYLKWLNMHIKEMTEIDGIISGCAFINTENENEIVCHYTMRDRAAMTAYLAGPAQKMRTDGTNRFGTQFSAKRRILKAL